MDSGVCFPVRWTAESWTKRAANESPYSIGFGEGGYVKRLRYLPPAEYQVQLHRAQAGVPAGVLD